MGRFHRVCSVDWRVVVHTSLCLSGDVDSVTLNTESDHNYSPWFDTDILPHKVVSLFTGM